MLRWPKVGWFADALERNRKLKLAAGPTTTFVAKQKLHGTNAGVHFDGHGKFSCQSRQRTLTPGRDTDNFDFASFVQTHLGNGALRDECVVFGEYCGPRIIGEDACSRLSERMLFVFAVYHVARRRFIWQPEEISAVLEPWLAANPRGHELVHVLPLRPERWTLCMQDSHSALNDQVLADIDKLVEPMETRDPYFLDAFGIDGPGEGLVFSPVTDDESVFRSLLFKVKTPHHSERKFRDKNGVEAAERQHKVRVQTKEYGATFVTPARCAKILAMLPQLNLSGSSLEDFVATIIDDILTEEPLHALASESDKDSAKREIRRRATRWWYDTEGQRCRQRLRQDDVLMQRGELEAQSAELVTAALCNAHLLLSPEAETADMFAARVADTIMSSGEHDELLRPKLEKRARAWWQCVVVVDG